MGKIGHFRAVLEGGGFRCAAVGTNAGCWGSSESTEGNGRSSYHPQQRGKDRTKKMNYARKNLHVKIENW